MSAEHKIFRVTTQDLWAFPLHFLISTIPTNSRLFGRPAAIHEHLHQARYCEKWDILFTLKTAAAVVS